jgi:hypothetical protein
MTPKEEAETEEFRRDESRRRAEVRRRAENYMKLKKGYKTIKLDGNNK